MQYRCCMELLSRLYHKVYFLSQGPKAWFYVYILKETEPKFNDKFFRLITLQYKGSWGWHNPTYTVHYYIAQTNILQFVMNATYIGDTYLI